MNEDFINMNGWDTAYVARIPFINQAIVSQKSSPTSFRVKTDVFDCTGTFGDWCITTGGDNEAIVLVLPISEIAGVVQKGNTVVTNFTYQSLFAKVEVKLRFIEKSDSVKQLTIDSSNPPTDIRSLLDSNNKSLKKVLDEAYIKEILLEWLDNNLDEFNHIFAEVDLFKELSKVDAWAFCKPSTVHYVFLNGKDIENSYLGILSNTAGSKQQGGTPSISTSFIPEGCDASYIISSNIFMKTFLLNSIKAQFESFNDSDFNINPNGLSLTLVDGKTEKLKPVEHDGKTYHPVLTDLNAQIINSIITIYSKTSTTVLDEWYGSVTAYNNSQTWYSLELGQSQNGQTIVYKEAQPPVNNHSISKSTGFEIIETILGVIGIVVVLIATVLTDGAALVVLGSVIGILSGGIEVILSEFEENNQNDSPSIDLLVSNMTSPIRWTGANDFELQFAGLNGGVLQLGAKL